MNKITLTFSLFLLTPLVASAQSLQAFLPNLVTFISTTIIPFLFGMAFLFFVINVFRFFILGGANEEGREKAKYLAIYSISAFVFLIIFWGIINLLSSSLGLIDQPPVSDYMQNNVDYIDDPCFTNPDGPLCGSDGLVS